MSERCSHCGIEMAKHQQWVNISETHLFDKTVINILIRQKNYSFYCITNKLAVITAVVYLYKMAPNQSVCVEKGSV